jgi:tetratricopeptide (TPR) repeat protein
VVDEAEPRDSIGHAPTIESTPEDDLGSAASLLRGLADAPGAPVGANGPLRLGQRVADKYEVVAAIGEGGMGVVYRARDTRLDRDVALKVGSTVSAAALARMEREAQALARLTHPNVVVVHEVGEVAGRLFVAMELVDGGTARTWLKQAVRTPREIIALYGAAGDGLAAAHAAGIVHRDFKPDNVLVGEDGRPRVGDFGLAREVAGDEPDDEAAPASIEVTRAGAIVGTPAYMAPEQMTGDPVDARADQFAFAASLWESLYGARPFPGATPDEVKAAIESTEPRKSDRKVPRHVELALRRALRPAPAERWPSLAALVAELRRDPARHRRNLLLGAGAAVAIAGAVVVPLVLRDHGPAPCSDDAAALAPTWNTTRAAAIARAFDSAGGTTLWTSLKPRVDRYAHDWIAGHHAACTATRVDGSQSEAILDRRMACLGGARAQLEAVLADWTTGGRVAVAAAPSSIMLLSDLAACANVQALGKQIPLPADPKTRAAIDRAQAAIATARVAELHGDSSDPVALGKHTLEVATASGWPPVIALASTLKASLEIEAGDAEHGRADLQQAASQAIAAGDDLAAGFGYALLANSYADDRRAADAKPWYELARAIWKRDGEDPDLESRLLVIEAELQMLAGDFDAMLATERKHYELTMRLSPDDGYEIAAAHQNLALAYRVSGRWDDAAREFQVAYTTAEAALGKDHPITANDIMGLGEAEGRIGKLDQAREHFRNGIATLEAWYGPDTHVASALDGLAVVELNSGHEKEAHAAFDRELAILHERDPKSPRIYDVETNVGVMLAQFGHLADAVPYAERGLAGHLVTFGADNPLLNSDYILLAYVERGTGKLADAEKHGREAVRVVEGKLGASAAQAVNPRTELSYTLVAEGKAAEAAALMAPMLAVADVPPPAAAEAHMAYADALWRAGGDHARARAEAAKSRDAFAALGAPFKAQSDHAADWLRTHR